jgi:hypothetical protein
MANHPPLRPGHSMAVIQENALRLRGAGLSRAAAIKAALAFANRSSPAAPAKPSGSKG